MHCAPSIFLLKRAPLKGISGTQPPPRAPSAAVAWGGARACRIGISHTSLQHADIVQARQRVSDVSPSEMPPPSPVRWETRLIALNL